MFQISNVWDAHIYGHIFLSFSRAESGIDFLDGLGFHAIFTCYLALYVLEKSTRELNRTYMPSIERSVA